MGALLVSLGMVGLTGCKQERTPTLNCFPVEAQKWIYREGTTQSAEPLLSQKVSAKTATLYFDRSSSIVGYLNGADNDNRPLHVLINNLPSVASRAGTSAQYAPFGTTVEDPRPNATADLLNPNFYGDCKNGVGQSCDANLRSVFERIQSKPDELAAVVTDLWYTEADGAEKEGAVRLQAALTEILAGGRSVAIYGIQAPFKGQVYDIPAGGNETVSVRHDGTHPLFLIVVGTKGDVIEFDRQLEGTVGLLQSGLEQGTIHRSIFTIDPGPLRPVRKEPVKRGNEPGLVPANFETYPASTGGPALSLQQFSLDISRKAGRLAASQAKGGFRSAFWLAPEKEDFLPNTVHEGPLKANIRLWSRADEKDPCSQWKKAGRLVEDAPVGGGTEAAQYRFELSEKALANNIRRPGVYLISGQLERISVNRENSANRWAEAWSVTAAGAQRIAATTSRPGNFFPTLNLKQVMAILENALQTATERKGGGIVGFAVLVKAKR